jgi:aconitate hydratase 2/2-methylisocitrate dehydratase
VASILGKLPTTEEYMEYANTIDSMSSEIYRYLNFDQMPEYQDVADTVKIPVAQSV